MLLRLPIMQSVYKTDKMFQNKSKVKNIKVNRLIHHRVRKTKQKNKTKGKNLRKKPGSQKKKKKATH